MAPEGASPAATSTATPRAAVNAVVGTYTVVAGDNPEAIAAKMGIPPVQRAAWSLQLMTLNNVGAKGLQIGRVRKLPAGP
jgi:hypothetical protein